MLTSFPLRRKHQQRYPPSASNSSATTSSSPIPSDSPAASRKASPTRFSSSSIKSAPSPTASPNTTSFCASKKSSARRPASTAKQLSPKTFRTSVNPGGKSMILYRLFPIAILLLLACASMASAQDEPGAPPKILLLVHQEFRFGKEGERQKLEVAISRACDHLNVPNDWIDLESISGSPEALFFDPFDSFEHVDTAFADWGRIFAAHPELARMQEESQALVTSERTLIAER